MIFGEYDVKAEAGIGVITSGIFICMVLGSMGKNT